MTALRVLLADDHPIVRDGLRSLLDTIDSIEVVAEAASGEEAVQQAETVRPDVVIMDLQMPGIGGVEATRQIVERHGDLGVLVLTMYSDDASVFAAMRAGARGYVLKGAERDDILRAIQAVSRREAIFSPSVATRVLGFFTAADSASSPLPLPDLTQREREILLKIASGASNGQISRDLGITVKTVRNHVSNIFMKLQVADRAQAVVRARDAGLGGSEPASPKPPRL